MALRISAPTSRVCGFGTTLREFARRVPASFADWSDSVGDSVSLEEARAESLVRFRSTRAADRTSTPAPSAIEVFIRTGFVLALNSRNHRYTREDRGIQRAGAARGNHETDVNVGGHGDAAAVDERPVDAVGGLVAVECVSRAHQPHPGIGWRTRAGRGGRGVATGGGAALPTELEVRSYAHESVFRTRSQALADHHANGATCSGVGNRVESHLDFAVAAQGLIDKPEAVRRTTDAAGATNRVEAVGAAGRAGHADVANVERLPRSGQRRGGSNGDIAELGVGFATAEDEGVGAGGEVEHFGGKLRGVHGAVATPRDGAFGQADGERNVPGHRRINRLGVNVHEE